jgi:hypothetical protein
LIDELGTFDFTRSASNVVLVGGTGSGKTHLATGLGVKVIGQYGKRVRFYSTVDLVNQLEIEKVAGKQGRLAMSIGNAPQKMVVKINLKYVIVVWREWSIEGFTKNKTSTEITRCSFYDVSISCLTICFHIYG